MSKPVLKAEPIPFSSGYQLDVYCRYEHPPETWEADCERATFGGQTQAQARRAARRMGWTLHRSDEATCPYHNKILKGKKP